MRHTYINVSICFYMDWVNV